MVLIAELPTIRSIEIGGAVDGLRLPDLDPERVLGSIGFAGDTYSLERRGDGGGLTVNGAGLGESPHPLADGDVIRAGAFELTFHHAPLPDGERFLDTQLRWKQRVPPELRREGDEPPRDDSTPYISEFELAIRPLINSEQHDEVERRVSAELLRLIRADEAETLERYARFLWSIRIAALARAGKGSAAEEACEQAIDLFPGDASLLLWLAMSQLRRREWSGAESSFGRALRVAGRGELRTLHTARVGLLLTQDERQEQQRGAGYRRALVPHSHDWVVPELQLAAPGDELLYWHLLRTTGLFGPEATPQFRFLGYDDSPATSATLVQRWEIFDRSAGRVYRRLIRLPRLIYAEPSLVAENALVRQFLNEHEPTWVQGLIDLSDEQESIRRAPVILEPSVIEALANSMSEPRYLRLATSRQTDDRLTFHVNLVTSPMPDDVIYEQGAIKVAVAERDVELLAGARLSWRRDSDGEGFYLESPNFSRVRVVSRRDAPKVAKPHGRWRELTGAIAASVVILAVLRLLLSWLTNQSLGR